MIMNLAFFWTVFKSCLSERRKRVSRQHWLRNIGGPRARILLWIHQVRCTRAGHHPRPRLGPWPLGRGRDHDGGRRRTRFSTWGLRVEFCGSPQMPLTDLTQRSAQTRRPAAPRTIPSPPIGGRWASSSRKALMLKSSPRVTCRHLERAAARQSHCIFLNEDDQTARRAVADGSA